MVNQMRFGYTRRKFHRSSLSAEGATLPVYDLTGFQQLGPPSNSNSRFMTSVTQWLNTLSLVRAKHSLKAGADVRLQHLNVVQPPNPAGLY